jgi:hypothetical protein
MRKNISEFIAEGDTIFILYALCSMLSKSHLRRRYKLYSLCFVHYALLLQPRHLLIELRL